ncbi:MAG: DNRLRE domain-containing protein [Byssovorax sp.]
MTGGTPDEVKRSLLRYDLSGVPSGADLRSATLALAEIKTAGKGVVRTHRITAPWSESTVTWNSFAGAFSAPVLASFEGGSPAHDLDAASFTRTWIRHPLQNFGVLFEQDTGAATFFKSSEYSYPPHRPALSLCYALPDPGPRSVSLVCKDASFSPIVPCGLPENTGAAGSYGTGAAGGALSYDAHAGAEESMHLSASGLAPTAHYLLTLTDSSGEHELTQNGARCLFGVKHADDTLEWCDVALLETDGSGALHRAFPTSAGLHGNCASPGVAGCVPTLVSQPNLGSGHYSHLRVALKNVGTSADGTAPDISLLTSGGTAQLYEQAELPAFSAP